MKTGKQISKSKELMRKNAAAAERKRLKTTGLTPQARICKRHPATTVYTQAALR